MSCTWEATTVACEGPYSSMPGHTQDAEGSSSQAHMQRVAGLLAKEPVDVLKKLAALHTRTIAGVVRRWPGKQA